MKWTINDLGLQKSRLSLEIIPKPGLRKTHKANGLTGRHDDLVGFAIDTTIPLPNLFASVAHEMIHVKQLAKGQLRYEIKGKKEQAFWCGRDMSDLPYYERPWEIEAYAKQEILARRFNDALQKESEKVNDKRKRKV